MQAVETSPTLFYNDANQHVAKMVETRIANTNFSMAYQG
jgi:phosphoribosylformylglycinamidine synthase